MLEAVLHCAGYRVGCYTSPHLLRYNERVRIGVREAADDDSCARSRRRGGARAMLADLFRVRHAGRAVAVRRARNRGRRAGGRPRRQARCRERVRRRLRGGRERRPGSHGVPRPRPRGHRLRERRHLPRRPARDLRRPEPPRVAREGTRARSAQLLADRPRFRLQAPRRRSGATGARAAGAAACRTRRCAARTSSATRRPRSRRSIRCATACRSRPGTCARGLLQAELAGRFQVLPGRPAGDPRRRAQSACRARAGREPARLRARRRYRSPCSRCCEDKDIAGVVEAVKELVEHWFVAAHGRAARRERGAACGRRLRPPARQGDPMRKPGCRLRTSL